jgi:hypothetical protein
MAFALFAQTGCILGAGWLGVVASVFVDTTCACAAPLEDRTGTVTNVGQLRGLDFRPPDSSYLVRLTGNVWWANPAQGRLVLQDGR